MTETIHNLAHKSAKEVENMCNKGLYGPNPTAYVIAKRAVMVFCTELTNEIMAGGLNPFIYAPTEPQAELLKALKAVIAESDRDTVAYRAAKELIAKVEGRV